MDIRNLLTAAQDIDKGYLREWALRLDVTDLLEECGA